MMRGSGPSSAGPSRAWSRPWREQAPLPHPDGDRQRQDLHRRQRLQIHGRLPVQLQNSNTIAPTSKVVITSILRIGSTLRGEEQYDEANEEQSGFEQAAEFLREPLPVVYNDRIPIETFDFAIVDECHRSIYNLWRQVLEDFDAFLIGLTATPTPRRRTGGEAVFLDGSPARPPQPEPAGLGSGRPPGPASG
jgi:type I site-specific restriction endonuclease